MSRSTHDSLAFAVLSLGRWIEENGLPLPYFLAMDDVYVCTNSLLALSQKSAPLRASTADGYNFSVVDVHWHRAGVRPNIVTFICRWLRAGSPH
eukprot:IDg11094t1